MKLLLATDGSKYAEEAAWLLSRLPHTEKLELTVLYVSNMPNLQGVGNATELLKQFKTADKEKADSILEQTNSIFEGANVTTELVVVEGQIGTQIVQMASSRDIDLIVLGAIGHSVFERMFGSTSDFVATHADCSVLIVRPTGLRMAQRPIQLCIGYDESSTFSVIVDQLSQFGWGPQTRMDLASVVSMPFNYSELPIPFDLDAMISLRKQQLDTEANRLRSLCPNVATHVLEENHVGNAIVQFGKSVNTDIIVLGKTDNGFLSTLFLGSVSKYVLRHAQCSVWIARSKKKSQSA
jgi:nucleotide-binding universal stress UspA family protein